MKEAEFRSDFARRIAERIRPPPQGKEDLVYKTILAIVIDRQPDAIGTERFVQSIRREAQVLLDWHYDRSPDGCTVHIVADGHLHAMKRTGRILQRELAKIMPADDFRVSKDGKSLTPQPLPLSLLTGEDT